MTYPNSNVPYTSLFVLLSICTNESKFIKLKAKFFLTQKTAQQKSHFISHYYRLSSVWAKLKKKTKTVTTPTVTTKTVCLQFYLYFNFQKP